MNTDTGLQASPQTVQNRILSLLNELPPESLTFVEQFVRFIHEQARRGQAVVRAGGQPERAPYLYPTIHVPASSLDRWLNLVPEGYDGDALADTEALYDEA